MVIASEVRYPFRKMPWQSNSRNEIARDIQDGIEKKHYKECIHLVVSEHHGYVEYGFSTRCEKGAFEWSKVQYPQRSTPFCNPECHYFEDKKQGERVEKRRKLSARVGYRFSRILNWYMSLHWVERAIILGIIFLVLLWFIAPNLIPQALEIIGNLVD